MRLNFIQNAKEKAKVVLAVKEVEKFLFHHRWTWGVVSKAVSTSAAVGVAHAVNGISTFAASTGIGNTVIAHGLSAGILGGGIGSIIATAVECGFVWRQYSKGRISGKEAMALSAISLTANAASAGTFIGGVAIGAACGAPAGPIGVSIGVTIGAIIGAVLVGLGVRWAGNKLFESYFQDERKLEIKLKEQALEFFF